MLRCVARWETHHDDAEREYAYDRKSPVGRFEKGFDEAGARGWPVVGMKRDWKCFPGEVILTVVAAHGVRAVGKAQGFRRRLSSACDR